MQQLAIHAFYSSMEAVESRYLTLPATYRITLAYCFINSINFSLFVLLTALSQKFRSYEGSSSNQVLAGFTEEILKTNENKHLQILFISIT